MEVDRRGIMARQFFSLFEAGTMNGLTDGQLLDLFADRAGESAELAFAALVERHGPMVHRVCRRMLGGAHDADDAFQATFLILARRAEAIRRRESVGPWLFGVALRVASCDRDARERRRARERRAGERMLEQEARRSREAEGRSELAGVVLEEVGRLPERYREAVVLCDLEGLGHEEAARLLGCPIGTVKSRQARGRERLRGRLALRGLAPSAILPASLPFPEPGRAAPPAALFEATARLMAARGAARTLAAGSVPVAVEALAEGVLRTMFLAKWKAISLVATLAAGLIATTAAVYAHQGVVAGDLPAQAAVPAKPGPAAEADSGPGLLIATGTVLMPDGSPASGATLTSTAESDAGPTVVRADEAGRFRLRGRFGNGGRLHASSADGSHQAVWTVSADLARVVLGSPLELRLAPATSHRVTVLAEGRPVEGAQVAASGDDFHVQGTTGRDGTVLLQLPATRKLEELVAWHPGLGVGGVRNRDTGLGGDSTRLSLRPRGSHTIRVVDPDGKPVAGLELALNVRTEDSEWIVVRTIAAAHVRTDPQGIAVVPWVPRDQLKYVEVRPVGDDWKADETDRDRMSEGITTVQVRRETDVKGRLAMPEGSSAEGILVTGFGFGPKNTGDNPYARAKRDGTFTLRVASEHGYILGISDSRWAADPWSGLILHKDSAKPAEITMQVYPATPVEVRVTRGARHEPVVDAYVEASSRGEVKWLDAHGEKRSGSGGVRLWLKTDATGVARTGVGRGEQRLRVASGLWDEEREIRVTSDQPVQVDFHRPWLGQRRIGGRLMLGGARYQPSPSLVGRAWTPQSQRFPLEFEPVVRPDGTFEVSFDAPALSLYFFDRDRRLGGFASRGLEDRAVDLSLEPAAAYGGTLLDEGDRPMADRAIQVYVKTSRYEAVSAQQTDKLGRFRFDVVPAGVPLRLNIRNDPGDPEYFLFDGDRLFQPGEDRKDDRVRPQRSGSSSPVARAAIPLADRVANLCWDAHSSGLLGLVALQGDQTPGVVKAVDHLFDDDRVGNVLSFLTLRVDSDRLRSDAAFLAENGWPIPGPGEIVLVALDGDRKTIAARRVSTTNQDADAEAIGAEFLKENRPPACDALKLLAEARINARSSGRRVWLVHGGPRCAPCFRLARWMDEHHAALEKDFVIVKLMGGVDEHVGEVIAGLPEREGDGIPWFAITESDGTVLATSSGPLGNIGFPSSVEGIRHLRQMLDRTVRRLTPDEVEGLIKSLSRGQ